MHIDENEMLESQVNKYKQDMKSMKEAYENNIQMHEKETTKLQQEAKELWQTIERMKKREKQLEKLAEDGK